MIYLIMVANLLQSPYFYTNIPEINFFGTKKMYISKMSLKIRKSIKNVLEEIIWYKNRLLILLSPKRFLKRFEEDWLYLFDLRDEIASYEQELTKYKNLPSKISGWDLWRDYFTHRLSFDKFKQWLEEKQISLNRNQLEEDIEECKNEEEEIVEDLSDDRNRFVTIARKRGVSNVDWVFWIIDYGKPLNLIYKRRFRLLMNKIFQNEKRKDFSKLKDSEICDLLARNIFELWSLEEPSIGKKPIDLPEVFCPAKEAVSELKIPFKNILETIKSTHPDYSDLEWEFDTIFNIPKNEESKKARIISDLKEIYGALIDLERRKKQEKSKSILERIFWDNYRSIIVIIGLIVLVIIAVIFFDYNLKVSYLILYRKILVMGDRLQRKW